MRIQDLLEQRGGIVSELRTLTETPTGDGGDLSSEQSERFDKLKGDLTSIEKRIERQRLIDAGRAAHDRRATRRRWRCLFELNAARFHL